MRSKLRGAEKRETKLVVIDTQTLTLTGYEGRTRTQQARVTLEEDTDADWMKWTVEDFRRSSGKDTVQAEKSAMEFTPEPA